MSADMAQLGSKEGKFKEESLQGTGIKQEDDAWAGITKAFHKEYRAAGSHRSECSLMVRGIHKQNSLE